MTDESESRLIPTESIPVIQENQDWDEYVFDKNIVKLRSKESPETFTEKMFLSTCQGFIKINDEVGKIYYDTATKHLTNKVDYIVMPNEDDELLLLLTSDGAKKLLTFLPNNKNFDIRRARLKEISKKPILSFPTIQLSERVFSSKEFKQLYHTLYDKAASISLEEHAEGLRMHELNHIAQHQANNADLRHIIEKFNPNDESFESFYESLSSENQTAFEDIFLDIGSVSSINQADSILHQLFLTLTMSTADSAHFSEAHLAGRLGSLLSDFLVKNTLYLISEVRRFSQREFPLNSDFDGVLILLFYDELIKDYKLNRFFFRSKSDDEIRAIILEKIIAIHTDPQKWAQELIKNNVGSLLKETVQRATSELKQKMDSSSLFSNQ